MGLDLQRKDHSAMETEHKMLDLPRNQEQRIKDASMRTMRNALRAVQTTRNALRRGKKTKEKEEAETRQTRTSLQDKKEEGKTPEDTAECEDPQLKTDNPARWSGYTENSSTKGHDNLDQIDQRKRTSS